MLSGHGTRKDRNRVSGKLSSPDSVTAVDKASIALCHEWLRYRHGSEKTFEQMAAVFPEADLYSLTWNRAAGLEFGGREVQTTFLDRVAPLRNRHALQLP